MKSRHPVSGYSVIDPFCSKKELCVSKILNMRKRHMHTSVLGKYVNTQMRIVFSAASVSAATKEADLTKMKHIIPETQNTQPAYYRKSEKQLLTGWEF
jgi:hypothetical protein